MVEVVVEKKSNTRMEYYVKAKSNFKSRIPLYYYNYYNALLVLVTTISHILAKKVEFVCYIII